MTYNSLINVKILLAIAIVLLSCTTVVHSKDKYDLSATISATSFPLDRGITLSVTLNGSRSASVNMPQIDNLIFHRRGQSNQVQMINGSYSSSITSNFIIQATKAGKYTIPPIEVEVDGQVLQTEPLSFEVTSSSAASGPNSGKADADGGKKSHDEVAFAIVKGIKDKAYTGEVIPIEIKAYFKNGLRVEIHQLPTLKTDAFIMSPLDQEPLQTAETFNGKSYSVIVWQAMISPIKEGNYDLVLELKTTLLFPQRNSRSLFNDPFFSDDFFGGMFGGYQRENVTLTTKKQATATLPLPQENRPENFTGAIGEFDFEVEAEPTDIEVGDPITLTMKIAGKGNFDRVTAPPFPTDSNWKTYTPSSKFISGKSNYIGEKVFEQAIVAKTPTIDGIPPLTFSYFDPKQNRYISKSSTQLHLNFKSHPLQLPKQPQTVLVPPSSPTTEEQKSTSHLLPLATIRLEPGSFTSTIQPLFSRTWYLVSAGCSALVLIMVFFAALRKKYLFQNSGLLEKKRVEKLITEKLSMLQQSIDMNNGHDFLQGCRHIIQTQLGMLWQTEPSAITPADLQQKLAPHSTLITIFTAAEQSAYGGGSLTAEEMKTYLELLKKELEEVS